MFDKLELKKHAAGAAPKAADLTADECAWLASGGRIECEVVGGQWVKRKAGPGNHKAIVPTQRTMKRQSTNLDMMRLKLKLLEM